MGDGVSGEKQVQSGKVGADSSRAKIDFAPEDAFDPEPGSDPHAGRNGRAAQIEIEESDSTLASHQNRE